MQPALKQRLEQLLRSGPQRIHLIGVCGSGMSGLARLLLAQGHRVSGSDLVPSQDASYVPEGLIYFEGHAAAHVADVALVVFSSAIAAENPERVASPRRKSVIDPRAKKKTGSHHDTIPTTAKYVKYKFSIMRSPRMSICAPTGVARFFRRAM